MYSHSEIALIHDTRHLRTRLGLMGRSNDTWYFRGQTSEKIC